MLRRGLLVCGIISSVLYIAVDMVAATSLYPGYSYTGQQVSELSAIGAPTRTLFVAMSSVWATLVIAFATGVWLSAGPKRSLRVAAIGLATFGIVGWLWAAVFPMHLKGTTGASSDFMHIALAPVQILGMVLFMAFASGSDGKAFRIYSIATIVATLVFGALPGTQVAAIAAGRPTPWFGLIERVAVYAPIVFVFALAVVLLKAGAAGSRTAVIGA